MNHISYNQFFAALAADSRLDILQCLKKGGALSVSAIAEATGQEQSAVSHNLKKLLACGCVDVQAQGKSREYSLNSETVGPLLKLVDKHIQKYCQNCTECSKGSCNVVPGISES